MEPTQAKLAKVVKNKNVNFGEVQLVVKEGIDVGIFTHGMASTKMVDVGLALGKVT